MEFPQDRLDEISKNELVNIINKLFKKFNLENWKIFCHHMTIAFNNKSNEALELFEQSKQNAMATYNHYKSLAEKCDF